MRDRKLILVLFSVTTVFGQQYSNPKEASDGHERKDCERFIWVNHGKILVNTRLQTSNERKWQANFDFYHSTRIYFEVAL